MMIRFGFFLCISFNTLTADNEHSRHKGWIYRYKFKYNYLKNQRHFAAFYWIFGIYIKFWTFWKKIEPHGLSISAIIDSKRRANASFFCASSELVPFCWVMADLSDFSIFPKLVKDLKFIWVSKPEALWKLPVTRQVVTNFLILLINLIASLPKHLWFKCNPPLFN